MKTLITAAVIAGALSTPALANKTPVKPTKPEVECTQNVKLETMIMYHLNEIENIIAEYYQKHPEHKPKPKDNFKNKS